MMTLDLHFRNIKESYRFTAKYFKKATVGYPLKIATSTQRFCKGLFFMTICKQAVVFLVGICFVNNCCLYTSLYKT